MKFSEVSSSLGGQFGMNFLSAFLNIFKTFKTYEGDLSQKLYHDPE